MTYPHCTTCRALCHKEHLVLGECCACTRKTMRALRQQLKELEKKK